MKKFDWMREVEQKNGWKDIGEGAWVKRNGLWVRMEILADLWDWSDWLCPCCDEPLLHAPGNYLACQWSGRVILFGKELPYRISGISYFPCLRCYRKTHETRTIYLYRTTITKGCTCGLKYTYKRMTNAVHLLPVGYTCRVWREPSREAQISDQLAEIKRLLTKGGSEQ